MQRGSHVDAGVVVVCAFETDILRAQICADALEKASKRDAAPLADGAPALDANVPRHLILLRHCAQVGQRPASFVGHKPCDFESPSVAVDLTDLALAVIGIERKG